MSRLADGAGAFCRGRSTSKLIGKTAPEHREDGRLFRLQTRKCITQLILYLGLDLEQQIAVHGAFAPEAFLSLPAIAGIFKLSRLFYRRPA